MSGTSKKKTRAFFIWEPFEFVFPNAGPASERFSFSVPQNEAAPLLGCWGGMIGEERSRGVACAGEVWRSSPLSYEDSEKFEDSDLSVFGCGAPRAKRGVSWWQLFLIIKSRSHHMHCFLESRQLPINTPAPLADLASLLALLCPVFSLSCVPPPTPYSPFPLYTTLQIRPKHHHVQR